MKFITEEEQGMQLGNGWSSSAIKGKNGGWVGQVKSPTGAVTYKSKTEYAEFKSAIGDANFFFQMSKIDGFDKEKVNANIEAYSQEHVKIGDYNKSPDSVFARAVQKADDFEANPTTSADLLRSASSTDQGIAPDQRMVPDVKGADLGNGYTSYADLIYSPGEGYRAKITDSKGDTVYIGKYAYADPKGALGEAKAWFTMAVQKKSGSAKTAQAIAQYIATTKNQLKPQIDRRSSDIPNDKEHDPSEPGLGSLTGQVGKKLSPPKVNESVELNEAAFTLRQYYVAKRNARPQFTSIRKGSIWLSDAKEQDIEIDDGFGNMFTDKMVYITLAAPGEISTDDIHKQDFNNIFEPLDPKKHKAQVNKLIRWKLPVPKKPGQSFKQDKFGNVKESTELEEGVAQKNIGNAIADLLLGEKAWFDLVKKDTGEVIWPAGKKITSAAIRGDISAEAEKNNLGFAAKKSADVQRTKTSAENVANHHFKMNKFKLDFTYDKLSESTELEEATDHRKRLLDYVNKADSQRITSIYNALFGKFAKDDTKVLRKKITDWINKADDKTLAKVKTESTELEEAKAWSPGQGSLSSAMKKWDQKTQKAIAAAEKDIKNKGMSVEGAAKKYDLDPGELRAKLGIEESTTYRYQHSTPGQNPFAKKISS